MVNARGRKHWSPFYVKFAIVRAGSFLRGCVACDWESLPSVHENERVLSRRTGLHGGECECCRRRRMVASVREGRRADCMPRPALGVAGGLKRSYTGRG